MESKKFNGNTILVAAITGLFTLGGTMSSSITGWISSSHSAEIARREACITRIDTQEQNFREKADLFLSAIGNFIALTGRTQLTPEIYDSRLDELMKAGYAFSAYASGDLSVLSRNMVISLKGALDKDEKSSEQALNSFNDTTKEWNVEFQEFLIAMRSERSGC
ncbi:hypothetical protein JQR88_10895 [Pseudomonas luteola]|uniref:hypothetical protein n=1 Tax=Pseudomonas luteola TaxID=47886 RepID=UPI003DA0CAE2